MDRLLDLGTKETVLHASLPLLVEVLEWIAAGIDLFAILLLVIGALRFMVGFIRAELRRDSRQRLRTSNRARLELGNYILAGLELFIVSDVIHTALSLAATDLIFLLLLVIIRSITSYFLDRELSELRQELGDDPR
ncbi:Uncharacterized membrane protein [Pseudosulfitobacter pseudonitzschiae]|uniref:DUF1622 domain-containing protein n=1 Tax=Pseudosulfitobacter pseudonitzschiae TaxID=1402135 RepID=A0A073J5X8_9RHOB|nr:DUF1622 domain-containing protein [Pseudosulfitobacter pseudonitzschiae]KEJ98003.1 hypothetical protein SUH3_03160 [Pseudosulfitobacter pseudonitzschiae]QKS09252.1 DUF1622 domain-containing protein [Pseudosulfitobacter pseudonitzschiae]SHE50342.1 Uncharacterized membrane protein [Pseudosulfitobacter pseudonitzschiae]